MAILEAIKRSEGKTVSQLAKELEMSYMGIKQNCVNLEKMGYLKTWRVPRKDKGRPEKLYQLTAQCDVLFPQAGVGLTLDVMESVRQLYGETAPEKLLFSINTSCCMHSPNPAASLTHLMLSCI